MIDDKLRPVVGYILWHLLEGTQEAEIVARVLRDSRYGWLNPQELNESLDQAKLDAEATRNVALQQTDESLIEIIGVPVPLDQPLGVRVFTILHCANGMDVETSVTVNTDPNNSPEDILAAVEDMINSGAIPWKNKYCTEVVSMDSEIAQVILGGFNKPSIALMEL